MSWREKRSKPTLVAASLTISSCPTVNEHFVPPGAQRRKEGFVAVKPRANISEWRSYDAAGLDAMLLPDEVDLPRVRLG
jgi:hypothetical protein